jgi:alkylation response protein AidB-like acyl-CoA dehydrogenase
VIELPPATLPPSAAALRLEVREFLAQEIADGRWRPRADSWLSGFDPEFSARLGARGWLGMTWPEQYGGHERSALERYVVGEELLASGGPLAAHWIADRQTGPLLLRYGTEDQRRQFLPAIARGECYFAIGMSEPDAGSDLAAIRTRAEKVDGGWKLYGAKIWTSHASHAHRAVTLVRTSPKDEDRHAGMSQLIVDLRADDLEVRPIRITTGEPHFNELVFDGTFVPQDMLVGTEGDGWHQVVAELAYERSGPERFLSTMPVLTALCERVSGPHAERAIGAILARLWTLRAMSLGVAAGLEAGEQPVTQAALVKDLGTRFEREVTALARELSPADPRRLGKGVYASLLADAILAAPGGTLRGGTNEILRGVVARALGVR